MKILSLLLPLAALLPFSLGAGTPKGYISSFLGADCIQAAGADDILQRVETILPVNSCENIRPFASFQGGVEDSCPDGTTPKVTAFSAEACGGNAVDAGLLPSDKEDGNCKEIVIILNGKLTAGGKSARFTCV